MHMKVTAVYFSPTGNTKKSVEAMAGALDPNFTVIDVTAPEQASVEREFSSEELVIFGMPVYMGRIPSAAAPRLQGLKGNHTPCILAATYGNRHYDDALAEMAGIAERNGFLIQGAAALVGRHTYGEIQVGRPDEADLEADRAFARKAAENKKMQSEIPGKYPEGEAAPGGHYKPLTSSTCIQCGICRKGCPVGAIGDDFQVDPERCISCFRCIRNCPVHAKNMDTPEYREFAEMFTEKLSKRRENEYFL